MKANFDVIIIGGSYAGLSAAMALGRALRQVLVIDSGNPCNKQTLHAHNLITHDGAKPADIAKLALFQVAAYPSICIHKGVAVKVNKQSNSFTIATHTGSVFTARKVLLATGILDMMPNIAGFAECWGISVLHCPYCHGYEVRNQPTAVFANGDAAFEFSKTIHNWTKNLSLLTNGPSQLSKQQTADLEKPPHRHKREAAKRSSACRRIP